MHPVQESCAVLGRSCCIPVLEKVQYTATSFACVDYVRMSKELDHTRAVLCVGKCTYVGIESSTIWLMLDKGL